MSKITLENFVKVLVKYTIEEIEERIKDKSIARFLYEGIYKFSGYQENRQKRICFIRKRFNRYKEEVLRMRESFLAEKGLSTEGLASSTGVESCMDSDDTVTKQSRQGCIPESREKIFVEPIHTLKVKKRVNKPESADDRCKSKDLKKAKRIDQSTKSSSVLDTNTCTGHGIAKKKSKPDDISTVSVPSDSAHYHKPLLASKSSPCSCSAKRKLPIDEDSESRNELYKLQTIKLKKEIELLNKKLRLADIELEQCFNKK